MKGDTPNETNCDKDRYFPELGQAMYMAFLQLAQRPNTYFGQWHACHPHVSAFFNTMWETVIHRSAEEIAWVNYHCLLRDEERAKRPDMLNFVKAIRANPRKKIYVCNAENARMCTVFGAEHVEIPPNCWFLFYKEIMNTLREKIGSDSNAIVLFSAGLCAKVAIAELVARYPEITCLDVGSSFDCLARGEPSRTYQQSFMDEFLYYSEVLPSDWITTTRR